MLINNATLNKLLDLTIGNPDYHISVNNEIMRIIPDEYFSKDEIEELRDIDNFQQEMGYPPSIVNFLPDDVRPEGIKKL